MLVSQRDLQHMSNTIPRKRPSAPLFLFVTDEVISDTEHELVTGQETDWDRLSPVTVVKINAITVPADSGDELAHRFAARAGAVDDQDGFEGFELLKPTDGRTTWLVVTRWRNDEAFQAWLHSAAFGHGHRSAAERAGGESPGPVGVGSELWSYQIAGGSSK
jgi:heme oxygenase (mycobilin-producing)